MQTYIVGGAVRDELLGRPNADRDYVVVGDVEGYLYWLDRTDGSIKAMQQLDSSGLYAAPLVDGDTLYVQSRGGKLYAIKRP